MAQIRPDADLHFYISGRWGFGNRPIDLPVRRGNVGSFANASLCRSCCDSGAPRDDCPACGGRRTWVYR